MSCKVCQRYYKNSNFEKLRTKKYSKNNGQKLFKNDLSKFQNLKNNGHLTSKLDIAQNEDNTVYPNP